MMTTESDIKQLIQESNQLIKDLGWTVEQAKQHLIDYFNKKSRYLLNINEWAEYLDLLRTEKACSKIFTGQTKPPILKPQGKNHCKFHKKPVKRRRITDTGICIN